MALSCTRWRKQAKTDTLLVLLLPHQSARSWSLECARWKILWGSGNAKNPNVFFGFGLAVSETTRRHGAIAWEEDILIPPKWLDSTSYSCKLDYVFMLGDKIGFTYRHTSIRLPPNLYQRVSITQLNSTHSHTPRRAIKNHQHPRALPSAFLPYFLSYNPAKIPLT